MSLFILFYIFATYFTLSFPILLFLLFSYLTMKNVDTHTFVSVYVHFTDAAC